MRYIFERLDEIHQSSEIFEKFSKIFDKLFKNMSLENCKNVLFYHISQNFLNSMHSIFARLEEIHKWFKKILKILEENSIEK